MVQEQRTNAKPFHRGIVVDAHVHPLNYLPAFASTVFRWFNRHTVPPEFFFSQLPSTGVDAIVANAVGDWAVTAWWGRPPWRAIEKQLARIRAQTEQAHVTVATSARHMWHEFESNHPVVIMGLEGADGIGHSLARVDELFDLGVRVLTPVHLRDNQVGTTSLPWQRYLGNLAPVRRRERGLTAFGRSLIRRMNSLGMIIDVSHSDTVTVKDVTEMTTQPVIASHSGSRKIEEFERFLHNEEIMAIAKTGGLVGLWPYRYKGHGAANFNELMRHARHIADLVGSAHLCFGTDINGVPGMMAGYHGEQDVRLIAEHLSASGFNPDEVDGIMGRNFMRLFEQILPG